MPTPLRVLIVEDSENDALLLLRSLWRGGYEPQFERVDTPEAMAAALSSQAWDIVISDYSMPHFSGLAALWVLKQSGLDVPFILMSGTVGEDVAVEAMKAGAHDYVLKNKPQRLVCAIEREIREAAVRRETRLSQERLRYLANYDPLTDLPNRNLFYERLEQTLGLEPSGKQAAGADTFGSQRFPRNQRHDGPPDGQPYVAADRPASAHRTTRSRYRGAFGRR